MKREKVFFVLLSLQIPFCILTFSQNNKVKSSIVPVQLYCEYLKNPVGIDKLKPRLSWISKPNSSQSRGLSQTAYQIIVATSKDFLVNDKGDIWNSGKVLSDQSVHIKYSGKPLVSHTWYYWKVKVFDQDDRASAWSDPAFWVTGLLSPDDWKAKWISWQPAPPPGTPVDPHGSVSPWAKTSTYQQNRSRHSPTSM